MTKEILCYNYECKGNIHWCCKDGKECTPKNCEYYDWYRKFVKRGE